MPVTILLVEDNAIQGEMLAKMLMERGYEVVVKEDARLAMSYLKSASPLPDVILLDILLPQRTGIDFSIFLKTSERTKNIPLIAVSSTIHGRGIANAMSAGFDAMFAKPVKVDELSEQIKVLLAAKASR